MYHLVSGSKIQTRTVKFKLYFETCLHKCIASLFIWPMLLVAAQTTWHDSRQHRAHCYSSLLSHGPHVLFQGTEGSSQFVLTMFKEDTTNVLVHCIAVNFTFLLTALNTFSVSLQGCVTSYKHIAHCRSLYTAY
jgi:hypothetical protein